MNRDRGLYGQSNTEYGASMAIAALAKNLTTYLIVAHNDKVVRDAMNNQADPIPRIDPISELAESPLTGHSPVPLDAEGDTLGSAPMHVGKTCCRSDGIMMSEMIVITEISLQATRERLL